MPVVASEAALTPHDVCLWHKADMLNALTMSASGGKADIHEPLLITKLDLIK
jgi:hypothetical protein